MLMRGGANANDPPSARSGFRRCAVNRRGNLTPPNSCVTSEPTIETPQFGGVNIGRRSSRLSLPCGVRLLRAQFTFVERTPEPELMLGAEQVNAYAAADFAEPHQRFVDLVKMRLAPLRPHGVALDLGCGPGDIAFRFLRAFPEWCVDALDGSAAMIAAGRAAAVAAGLHNRIAFHAVRLPDGAPPRRSYDLLFSNSLLHHLANPAVLWSSLRRWSSPATRVFVMDLLRPASQADALALVERYAGGEPAVLRTDFYNSLCAAYRPDEVAAQLKTTALSHLVIEVISDRHLIVWGTVEIDRSVRSW
jgi:SAM-dependent methyltransferase